MFFLVSSTRVVGWWVGNTDSPSFPLEKFPWDIYTHIRIGDPVINQNASVFCNKTDYKFHHIVLTDIHNMEDPWITFKDFFTNSLTDRAGSPNNEKS